MQALEALGIVQSGKLVETDRHAYRTPAKTIEIICAEYLAKQGIACLTDADGTHYAFGEAAVAICQILNKRRYANNLHGALSEAVALKATEVSEDWQDGLSNALTETLDRKVTIEESWAALGWTIANSLTANVGASVLKYENGKRVANWVVSDKLKELCTDYGMAAQLGKLFV